MLDSRSLIIIQRYLFLEQQPAASQLKPLWLLNALQQHTHMCSRGIFSPGCTGLLQRPCQGLHNKQSPVIRTTFLLSFSERWEYCAYTQTHHVCLLDSHDFLLACKHDMLWWALHCREHMHVPSCCDYGTYLWGATRHAPVSSNIVFSSRMILVLQMHNDRIYSVSWLPSCHFDPALQR